MDTDSDLLHYAVHKGIAEHRQAKRHIDDLRALLLESIMLLDNEEAAERLMVRYLDVEQTYKDSPNAQTCPRDPSRR